MPRQLEAIGGGELDVQEARSTIPAPARRQRGGQHRLGAAGRHASLKLVGGGTVTLASGGTIVGNRSPARPTR